LPMNLANSSAVGLTDPTCYRASPDAQKKRFKLS
jgi:hypothetical protein